MPPDSHRSPDGVAEPVDPLLAEAHAALRHGDIARARRCLDDFDGAMERRDMSRDRLATGSWPLRLACDRWEGRPEEAIATGSRLTRLARGLDWDGPLAELLVVMGHAAMDLGNFSRAQIWLEEALEHARRVGSDRTAAGAERGLAMVWELRGEPERFRVHAELALTLAEGAGDTHLVAECLTVRARYRIKVGDPAGEADLERAKALFEQCDDPVSAVRTLIHRLPTALRDRDAAKARALIDEANRRLAETKDQNLRGMLALDHGEVYRLEGDLSAARAQYEASLALLAPSHPFTRVARTHLVLADLVAGDLDAASAAIPELLEVNRDHRQLNGVTHLVGLAVGPVGNETEDDVWSRHGTPARLALEGVSSDPDAMDVAERAVRRMMPRADAIQAGRAAVVMGLVSDGVADDLVRGLRSRNAALPIGPFLALQKLGAGGMGEVWLGRHVDSDTPAALKVVNQEMRAGDLAWETFDNEMKAVSALSHPNIVGMLDHGRAGVPAARLSGGSIRADSPYLALQYVRGGTLTRWIGRMSWPQIRVVLASLLDALAHAHARGVLHLDLKPENILLNDRKEPAKGVRLTDFGLSLLREDTRKGIAGTLEFMAPEQYVLGSTYGPWTDLYAFGCLAWGLLTNAPPFHSKSKREMAELHGRAPLPKFAPIVAHPPDIEDWLRQLLAKDPAHRTSRASDALNGLMTLDAGLRDPIAMDTEVPESGASAHSLLPTLGASAMHVGLGLGLGRGGARPAGSPVRVVLPATWALPDTEALSVPDAGLALVHEREPPLVGRHRERDVLWELVRTTHHEGRPQALVVQGPLGSGRSALLEWLAARTHEVGFTEVIRHRGSLTALIDGPPPVSPGALALRLMQAIERRRGGRLALVLLDETDPAMPEVVDILLREGEGAVLFVARAPPDVLKRNRTIRRLDLPRLTDDELRSILASVLPLEPSVMNGLVEWADGNPGLALSTLRTLARTGELRASPTGWSRPHGRTWTVPEALAHDVRTALQGVATTPDAWEAVQVAAASGHIVHRAAWTALSGDIGDLAQALEKARILEEKGGVFRWIQPAAMQVLAAEPATRVAHGRIAEHLTSIGAPPAVIARHFLAAHRYADAHRPLLDAVKVALDAEDVDLAADFYKSWIDALDRLAVSANDPRRLAGKRYAATITKLRREARG